LLLLQLLLLPWFGSDQNTDSRRSDAYYKADDRNRRRVILDVRDVLIPCRSDPSLTGYFLSEEAIFILTATKQLD
jgi:hypothetical protein